MQPTTGKIDAVVIQFDGKDLGTAKVVLVDYKTAPSHGCGAEVGTSAPLPPHLEHRFTPEQRAEFPVEILELAYRMDWTPAMAQQFIDSWRPSNSKEQAEKFIIIAQKMFDEEVDLDRLAQKKERDVYEEPWAIVAERRRIVEQLIQVQVRRLGQSTADSPRRPGRRREEVRIRGPPA